MSFKEIRGTRIRYEIVGESGPWLALTTGGRRGCDEFLRLAGKIAARGFRVVLHDRRNTGASEITYARETGDEGEEEIWADDLHALLSQLGALPCFVGGASSGARTSMLFYLRHREAVRALLLMRITGGPFAARRLPENYYGRFIRAAQEGGMAAVCATEPYQERIAANPANREALLRVDPQHFIALMTRWRGHFLAGVDLPVMGMNEDDLRAFDVPVVLIPGNDNVHSSHSAKVAHRLIPGSRLHQLPISDQDVPLIPFGEWGPYEDEIAEVFTGFMREHAAA